MAGIGSRGHSRADAQDDYADIGALEVSAYTPQRGTFGKDSAVVNRRIRKDGITTIENIQLSIAKSAYNQAEFVTLFVRGSDGQWSVGVARFKRVPVMPMAVVLTRAAMLFNAELRRARRRRTGF